MHVELPWIRMPEVALRLLGLMRSQWWDAERTGRFADARLRALVRHAGRHVPYYRDLFRQVGLDPGTFRGRVDLPRIPPLDKETLRRRRQEFVADNAARFRPVTAKTTGSTGTPLEFRLDLESRLQDAAATLRSYAWAGYRPGITRALWVREYGQSWETRELLGGRCLNYNPRFLDRDAARRLWARINRFRPEVFNGYPYALALLGQYGREAGLIRHPPRAIITIGESLTRVLRARLHEAYPGARIFDHYSMSENTALITTCPHGVLHVGDDHAFHEFLGEDDAPVTEGRAAIVGTNYFNFSMPLIRYRTRDFACLRPASRTCPCGRAGRTVETLEGRIEDHVRRSDGRLVTLTSAPLITGRGILASQYIHEQATRLRVNVLPGPDYDPASLAGVKQALHATFGEDFEIDFHLVDRLERRPGQNGKIPFLISRLETGLYQPGEFGS